MLCFCIAAATFSFCFSNSNSGVCTPMITNPLSLYFSYHAFKYGVVLWQLIQLYVQKSIKIIFLPTSSLTVIDLPSVFIKPSGVVISLANSYFLDFSSLFICVSPEEFLGATVTASFDPPLFTLFELMK